MEMCQNQFFQYEDTGSTATIVSIPRNLMQVYTTADFIGLEFAMADHLTISLLVIESEFICHRER